MLFSPHSIPMSLYAREAPEPIPSDEVPLWVQQTFITTCLNVMLTTLVVYDASTICSHSYEYASSELIYF